jgi:hypothetical protein
VGSRPPAAKSRYTDSNGNAINAPTLFAETTALRDLYAPLGVHFDGPGGNNGGAILDQGSIFSVGAALSQPNFLAFNFESEMSDGGIPDGPETISFDALASSVSIYAGSGSTYTLTAFNSSDSQIGQDVVTDHGGWNLLSVAASGIKSVTISNNSNVFVLDNLTVHTAVATPEPATLTLLGSGFLACGGLRLRRWRRSFVA